MTDSGEPPEFSSYTDLVEALKVRIRSARVQAALAVNAELVHLYWGIGQDILARQATEGWGARVIDRLADDLRRDFPDMAGLSGRNLRYMRAFAEAWPDPAIMQQVVARLPWGHNVRLLEAVKAPAERIWYARQAIEHGWSRNVLVAQIDSDLFARQGRALTNFSRTLPSPQSELAQQLVKDPYSFEFLALGPELRERDLERGLLDELRAFFLELGKGFAFVGSQYHLEVGGQDYYLDLLFYHLRLRCYVVIELKVEAFKPEFAGKMNFYLSAVDDQLRHPQDAPSIGIILCQSKNEVVVEYALRDAAKPMGVAGYRLSPSLPSALQEDLPTPVDIERELPRISLVMIRMEVERELVRILSQGGAEPDMRLGVGGLLAEFEARGDAFHSLAGFREALPRLNAAAHDRDLSPEEIKEAQGLGRAFLAELRSTRPQ